MAKKGKKKAAKEKIGAAERKRAEEALSKSEHKYMTLFENIPQRIFLKDKDSVYVSCNKNYARNLKLKVDEIAGKTDYDIFSKEEAKKFRAEDKRVMKSGKTEDIDERVIRNGRETWTHTVKTPAKDEKGNSVGVLGIFWDITERKRAEEMLQQSREKLKMTIESSPDAITVTDLKGNITECNQITLDLHGFSTKEELIGKSAFDSISPKDRERALENMKKTLKQGSVKNLEYTCITKDGHEFPVELSASVILDSSGKPEAFVAITKDITERKKAEEKIGKLAKFPSENPNPVLRVAKDGTILYANKASSPLLDVWGCQIGQLLPNYLCKTISDVFSSGLSKDTEVECGDRIFSLTLAPVVDAGYANLYGLDITERKRAEEALHKAHDELEVRVAERTEKLSQANIRLKELDKLKSMFMSSMSHELRTPLNSIIGFTGVMLQGIAGELTEEQRKQLTMVQNSSNHLLSMITYIIDLNKIEAGKIGVLIKETDIAKTIDEVLATFADEIREKGLALEKNIPEKLIISTDEKRFKQILINLLDNAVKFTVEGSIEVDCKVKGEEIEISVKDTGPGIREEGIEELFKPFAQVDYEFKVKYGGPGIGLYLSKRIVELLGGKIWAESEFSKGSRFTFVLPIKGAKT